MTPMVGRACRRAQASQAFGRFANAFASGLDRLVVDDCAGAGDRTLQQEAGELDQTPTQEIMQRLGFGDVARERVGLTQSARSSIAWWDLRFVCVAPSPNAGTLAPSLPAARLLRLR